MTAALLRILLFSSEVFPALFGLLSPHKVDMQICHLSLLQQDKVSGALCQPAHVLSFPAYRPVTKTIGDAEPVRNFAPLGALQGRLVSSRTSSF